MSRTVAAVVLVLAALTGCTSKDPKPGPTGSVTPVASQGAGEGALSLVSMSGNLEEGATDPRVDWVTPFERATGCQVTLRQAYSGQQVYDRLADGGVDGGLVPPEVADRLIRENHVAPVNTRLVESFKDLDPALRDQVKRDGRSYGVPFLWGAGQLMYDSQRTAAPTSWGSVFDAAQNRPYRGRVVLPDSPLLLADAALYLKAHQRSLKIKDPFELTAVQLEAATALVEKSGVRNFWTDRTDVIEDFTTGDAVLGVAGTDVLDSLSRGGRPVAAGGPKEGATAWLDTWMIATGAPHPGCMYKWLDWSGSPQTQTQAAEWRGAAPANPAACSTLPAGFCATYRVTDQAYRDRLTFVRAPARDCGGNQRTCTDWKDWIDAWATVN
ncbi:MAG: extracellular solute-binding protein [Streptosporangiaceae bacterium]